MPSAERYARYREDQTTIWVSKTAAAFLAREREGASEGTAAVLDRLLTELRRLRRGAPASAPAASTGPRSTTRSAGSATRSTTRPATRGTTRSTAGASRGARGTKTAARRSA